MELTHVDLFAGTGGFSLALRSLQSGPRIKTIFSNDILTESETIMNNNFDHTFLRCDINELISHTKMLEKSIGCDILTAGFPCQPFSNAGSRKGFSDPRAKCIKCMFRIIRYCKPRCILLENVKGLVNHNSGKTLKSIINLLAKLGYTTKCKVIDTAKVSGIPQHRERLYIIGFLDGSLADAFSGAIIHQIEKRDFRGFLEKESPPENFYYTPASAIYPLLKNSVVKFDTVYQYRRTFVRENKKNECPTLTRNLGMGGHNVPIILCPDSRIRKLTPRECFNLQGFPEDYNLSGISTSALYRLAGNAVSVPVVRILLGIITEILGSR